MATCSSVTLMNLQLVTCLVRLHQSIEYHAKSPSAQERNGDGEPTSSAARAGRGQWQDARANSTADPLGKYPKKCCCGGHQGGSTTQRTNNLFMDRRKTFAGGTHGRARPVRRRNGEGAQTLTRHSVQHQLGHGRRKHRRASAFHSAPSSRFARHQEMEHKRRNAA